MKQIRHGIIGMGSVSNDHIRGIAGLEGMRVSAIFARKQSVLDEKGEALGIRPEQRFLDYKELIHNPEVDSVSICTPNHMHYEMVKEAIAAGKPFAVEKPLSVTTQQAEELAARLRSKPIPHMVCFSYRFMPAVRYARYLVQSGQLGALRHVFAQYNQGWGNDVSRPMSWRFQKEMTGYGALGDLGSHLIDLVRFIAGEISEVSGELGVLMPQRMQADGSVGKVTVDDYAMFLARVNGNVPSVFTATRFAYGLRNYQRIEIYGSEGGLIYTQDLIDGRMEDHLAVCLGVENLRQNRYSDISVPQEYCCGQMEGFQRLLNGDSSGLCATIEDGLRVQRIMDAVAASAAHKEYYKVQEN